MTQNSTDLLLSLVAQVRDAQTSSEVWDLYFLARGVYYSESDAGNDSPELRSAWREMLDMTRDAKSNVAFEENVSSGRVVGLVTFADGSSYGGRK